MAEAAAAPAGSVQATWDNHFGGFNTADIPKILADYTETSEVQVYNETTGEKKVYVGQEAIGGLFAGIFELLGEHSANLKAPVLDVNAEQKQVFLVWNCEPVVLSATDTFILDDNFKFIRQNIVIRTAKAPASQSVQATWDNHFAGFGAGDVPKILEDYTATSEVQVHDQTTGETKVYVGQEAIGDMFFGLFELLGDAAANLKAPVLDINEAQKQDRKSVV